LKLCQRGGLNKRFRPEFTDGNLFRISSSAAQDYREPVFGNQAIVSRRGGVKEEPTKCKGCTECQKREYEKDMKFLFLMGIVLVQAMMLVEQ
jgi:hypothetical protein